MSDAVQPGFLRRLRYTPLIDLLRGRVSGRLDVRRRLDASALPPPARLLVGRVVRRTRLWRAEKLDVADELVSHFADGLAAGESADDLVAAFGDERQTARLIRRAKVRNRPLVWHGVRWLGRLTAVFLFVYAVLAVRFFVGEPRVSIDYLAKLNEPVVATPADQRAWPTYGRVLTRIGTPGLGDFKTFADNDAEDRYTEAFHKRLDARPAGKRWDELTAWLDAHAADVAALRAAAAKPSFGFVFGSNGSQVEWPLNMTGGNLTRPEDVGLIGVLLPALGHTRMLATVLAADCRLARQRRDGDRVAADVEALVSMSEQMRDGWLVNQLVGFGIAGMAAEELCRTLEEAPGLLDDAALVRLAHRFDAAGRRSAAVDVRGERMSFYDVVQRTFTDDGHGDGRLTPDGVRTLLVATSMTSGGGGTDHDWPAVPLAAVAPLGVVGSRREQLAEYDRLMDAAEAQFARPAREADWSPVYDRMREIRSSPLQSAKYFPVVLLMPSLRSVQRVWERRLGERDGMMVAVALELHRRRTGGYPPTLDALAPALLPAVPVDRITGGPLRYRLVDGRPIVYSVGTDRDDDGGRPATDRYGRPDASVAADWPAPAGAAAVDGDWVLYPALPPAPEDDE